MNWLDQRARLILLGLIFLSFATVLLSYAYVGIFNRWVADDYCSAASYRAYGFFGSQKFWYTTWTGRVSASFVGTVAHAIGPKLMPILPALVLAAWLAALMWAIRSWAPRARWARPWMTSFFLADLILVATISLAPSLFQSLYWMSGTLTYTPPLILLSLLVGILSREFVSAAEPRRNLWLVLCLAISFVAGGFNEMYLAFQSAGLCLAIVFCCVYLRGNRRRRLLSLLVAGVIGSILVGIILMSSPGNGIRVAESTMKSRGQPPHDVLSWLTATLRFAGSSIKRSIINSRPTTAAMLFFPSMLAFCLHGKGAVADTRRLLKWLLLLPLLALVLIAFYYTPVGYLAAYVRGGYGPQPRTEMATQFIFYCVAVVWSYLIGLGLRRVPAFSKPGVSLALAVIAVLLLVVPFNAVRRVFAIGSIMKQYAATWDAAEHDLRAAAPGGEFVVPKFPATQRDAVGGDLYFNVRLIGPHPTNWVNGCVAEYYGLKSVVARE